VAESASPPRLADAGWADQRQMMMLADPLASGELEEQGAVEAAVSAEILDHGRLAQPGLIDQAAACGRGRSHPRYPLRQGHGTSRSGGIHLEPARAREVYDVSGAGDTVLAVLALACASGYSLPKAMQLANVAAGVVVSKLGTATVEPDELMLELGRDLRDREWHRAKHYNIAEVEALVKRWKARGLTVGFTNGYFDIVHAGHIALLAVARAECDHLVVALNSDAGVRRLKGPERPLNALADRSCDDRSGGVRRCRDQFRRRHSARPNSSAATERTGQRRRLRD